MFHNQWDQHLSEQSLFDEPMGIYQEPISQYSSAFDCNKAPFSFPVGNPPPPPTQGPMTDRWVHTTMTPNDHLETFGQMSHKEQVLGVDVAHNRMQDRAGSTMLNNNSHYNQYPTSYNQIPCCSTTSSDQPNDSTVSSELNGQNGSCRMPLKPSKVTSAFLGSMSCNGRSEVSHVYQVGEKSHHNQRKRRNIGRNKRPASHLTSNHAPSSPSTSRDSERKQNSMDQRIPDELTITVCHIWRLKNPGVIPSEHQISCLSFLFDDSFDAVRHWFQRGVSPSQKSEEPACQSMTSSDFDFISTYRTNRRECNRKAEKSRKGIPNPLEFEWTEGRPFACTSRCGRLFQKKERWKRHEEINRPTRLWLCRFQACKNKMEGKRVWFRKDHFKKHLKNDHEGISVANSNVDACSHSLDSNFSKSCIFRRCNKQFVSWSQRINHIADHMKSPWRYSEWREDDEEIKHTKRYDDTESESQGSDKSESGSDENESNHSEDSDGDDSGLGPWKPQQSSSSGTHDSQSGSSDSSRDQGSGRQNRGSNLSSSSGYRGYHNENSVSSSSFGSSSNSTSSSAAVPMTRLLHNSPSGFGSMDDRIRVLKYKCTTNQKNDYRSFAEAKIRTHPKAVVISGSRKRYIAQLNIMFRQETSFNIKIQPIVDYNLAHLMNVGVPTTAIVFDMLEWFSHLTSALQYIYTCGFGHRNFGPRYIAVRSRVVRLSDFVVQALSRHNELNQPSSSPYSQPSISSDANGAEGEEPTDMISLRQVLLETADSLLQWLPKIPDALQRTEQNQEMHVAPASRDSSLIVQWIHKLSPWTGGFPIASQLFVLVNCLETIEGQHSHTGPAILNEANQDVACLSHSGYPEIVTHEIPKHNDVPTDHQSITSNSMNAVSYPISHDNEARSSVCQTRSGLLTCDTPIPESSVDTSSPPSNPAPAMLRLPSRIDCDNAFASLTRKQVLKKVEEGQDHELSTSREVVPSLPPEELLPKCREETLTTSNNVDARLATSDCAVSTFGLPKQDVGQSSDSSSERCEHKHTNKGSKTNHSSLNTSGDKYSSLHNSPSFKHSPLVCSAENIGEEVSGFSSTRNMGMSVEFPHMRVDQC